MENSKKFQHDIRVGWGDCDPASIAYTARLPDFSLHSIDAWWEAHLGGGWYELNLDHNLGTPFVHLSMDFRSPVTPRHTLNCMVWPAALGKTSIEFRVNGYQDGVLCFEGRFICVFTISAKMEKIPAPQNIRDIVEPLIIKESAP